MSQSSNLPRLVSWTWQWVHFTLMASTVTRSQSNRAALGCGGDSHHGCAADKSAATAWCYHVNMDQNLWGMFPTSVESMSWGIKAILNRHVEKGWLWGLKPLPFLKSIQKCTSQTNSNDTVVNKTKCIWIIVNMRMCTNLLLIAKKSEYSGLFLHICQSEVIWLPAFCSTDWYSTVRSDAYIFGIKWHGTDNLLCGAI